MENSIKAGLVVDQTGRTTDGGFLFDEVGEVEFEMSRFGVQLVLQSSENLRNALHMDEAAVILKDLEKPAHVSAFKLVGQIYREGDGGDGVLSGAGTVTDDDGIPKSLNPHLVDPEVTEVRGGLGVVKLSLP